MKKTISVITAFTTILWLTGIAMILPVTAVTFADGDLAREADEFDVYIIKLVGTEKFKRLILNPDVFNMYGHLKWENVQVVADGTLADYTTSELVRADGDEKVYKLFPDGDVGTKKWVDSLDCFTSQGYNWNSVYVINSFDRDSYTTASTTMCEEEPVVTGDITLSLASDTPAAKTIPYSGNSITMMKIKIEGTGTISQMTLKREGAGGTDDIGNAYLYEGGIRLTSGRTVSSATSKVTFINLSIDAPATIDVLVDFAGASTDAGNQHYFTLESAADVTSDATVGGSFPISGKPMSLAGIAVGVLTVIDSGSTAYNVTIGDVGVEISQFKITTGTEAAYLQRLRLYNAGTINSAKLTNLKLKYGADTKASVDAWGADGYATFIFDEPFYIKKGGSAIFRVYADISGGKPAETIGIYIELDTDIYGIGGTYNVGMDPAITGFDAYTAGTGGSDAIEVTLTGGDLTFVKVGPNAGNIPLDDGDDIVFLEYSMTAIADITISRTQLYWCWDDGGEGTYNAACVTTGTDSFDDIEDVKIVNKDTGVTWAGPHDGSAFSTLATDYCPGNAEGVYKEFTDTYDLIAGETYTMQITADTEDDNDPEVAELTDGDIIKVGLRSFVTAAYCANANYMKYTGTTNSVACTAIVPSGDIVGEQMKVTAPSLAVALAGTPSGTDAAGVIGTARTFVKGKTGIEIVGFVFTAGVASAVTVTDLTLTGYLDLDGAANALGDGVYTLGKEDAGYVKNLVSSVEIWDTTTGAKIPGSTSKGFGGTSYSTVAYTGLNWVIPAGESRTLLVKGNLSSIGPTNSAGFNLISFDIVTAASDITSQDKDGTDIAETGNAANGSTNPNVAIGVYDYGTIAVDDATDTPLQSIILMGSLNNEVSKFKLTGTREAWNIEKFSIGIEESTASKSNFTGMSLKYQTQAQEGTSDWTISTDQVFGADATLSFNFSGSARPYVPKDDYTYVTVLVDVDGYDAGTGANSGEYTNFWALTAEDDEFKAYGAESGKLIEGGSTSITADGTAGGDEVKTPMKNHYIFRSRPIFAKKAWSGDINELARFTITAQGYDVTFDGTSSDGFYFASVGNALQFDEVVSAALEFDVIASGTDSTEQILYLYDWNNIIISSVNDFVLSHADSITESIQREDEDGTCHAGDSTYDVCLTTVSFQFEEASTPVVIAKDVTREFYVMIDNTLDFNNQDEYLQLKMKQDEGVLTDVNDGNNDYDNCSIVWYDGTLGESALRGGVIPYRICMPKSMNGIGDFPMSFRLLQGTQQ